MRNAVSVQQKLVFPFLKKGDVTLSPLNSIFRSHWSPPLQLFFIRGRVLIQGVHHEHHVWPWWDRGVTRPHDFKAQEAECLQEWSYQREGNLLPPGIILFTCVTLEATNIEVHWTPSVSAPRASCTERNHFNVTALSNRRSSLFLHSSQLLLCVKGILDVQHVSFYSVLTWVPAPLEPWKWVRQQQTGIDLLGV